MRVVRGRESEKGKRHDPRTEDTRKDLNPWSPPLALGINNYRLSCLGRGTVQLGSINPSQILSTWLLSDLTRVAYRWTDTLPLIRSNKIARETVFFFSQKIKIKIKIFIVQSRPQKST